MLKIENIRVEDLLDLLSTMKEQGVEVIDMHLDIVNNSVTVVAVDSPPEDDQELRLRIQSKIEDKDIEDMI